MSVAVWWGPFDLLRGELGSHVTALSPVWRATSSGSPASRMQAGVRERVQPLLGDAHALEGRAIRRRVFVRSTTYFDRESYFESVARVVRAGGWCSSRTPSSAAPNWLRRHEYWTTNIGWAHDYSRGGPAACFDLFRLEDISRHSAGFWKLSVAYSRLLAEGDPPRSSGNRDSAAYLDGGLRNLLLSFRKRSPRLDSRTSASTVRARGGRRAWCSSTCRRPTQWRTRPT